MYDVSAPRGSVSARCPAQRIARSRAMSPRHDQAPDEVRRAVRQISVDVEAHASLHRDGPPLLLLHQLRAEVDRGDDIIDRDAVLLRDFLAAHPASKLSQNTNDRDPRPADHRPSVLNLRIDLDALVHRAIVAPRPMPSAAAPSPSSGSLPRPRPSSG